MTHKSAMSQLAFEPEFAGSAVARQAQEAILAHHAEIAAAPGMVSRAVRVVVLDASMRSPEDLVTLACRFGSAIFLVRQSQVEQYHQEIVAAGLSSASFLMYASFDATFTRSGEVVADELPQWLGLRTHRIGPSSPGELIAKVQSLLEECGLPALPGYFLRGRIQPNLTLALLDLDDAVVGLAVAMEEGSAGPAYRGWYFPGSVAVTQSWQGKGLGRWLNAAAIDLARREGGAVHVQEGVSPANHASRRMIESCGLVLNQDTVAILASSQATPAAWRGGPT
jgi:GNAT superfamily N-acetyltransferase